MSYNFIVCYAHTSIYKKEKALSDSATMFTVNEWKSIFIYCESCRAEMRTSQKVLHFWSVGRSPLVIEPPLSIFLPLLSFSAVHNVFFAEICLYFTLGAFGFKEPRFLSWSKLTFKKWMYVNYSVNKGEVQGIAV